MKHTGLGRAKNPAPLGQPGELGGTQSDGLIFSYSSALIAEYSGVYWGIQDALGASEVVAYPDTALNGTPSNVTLGEDGPVGTLAGSFNGTSSYVDIYSAGLNTLFDPTAFTAVVFAKMSSSGVWTDGGQRAILSLSADGSNVVKIFKDAGNNELSWRARSGGVTKSYTHAVSTTDWFCAGMTISGPLAVNEVAYYYNGAQVATDGTLGTWSGNLAGGLCTIGAWDTRQILLHSGLIAHIVILAGVATPVEILRLAQAGGCA